MAQYSDRAGAEVNTHVSRMARETLAALLAER